MGEDSSFRWSNRGVTLSAERLSLSKRTGRVNDSLALILKELPTGARTPYNALHGTHLHLSRHRHVRGRPDDRLRLLRLHLARPAQPALPLRRVAAAAGRQPADRHPAGAAAA